MSRLYKVAGHCFCVSGERLCKAVGSMGGFEAFAVEGGDALFAFIEGDGSPAMVEELYRFSYEDIVGVFGKSELGFVLRIEPLGETSLELWCNRGEAQVHVSGNMSAELLRFALWLGLGMMVAPHGTVAIHSSCVVYGDKAVLFLGESGTGKSTHSRLWLENIEGAFLMNDDSPFLRVEDGKVWAYGSPWSGKTPCYRQERYELKACVRLSQGPSNHITKLGVLQAYGAIHPSCPPQFAYDGELYDHVSNFIDGLLSAVDFYHLSCLPDKDAAMLSFRSIFLD